MAWVCEVDGCVKEGPSRVCSKHRARVARRGSVDGVVRIFGDDLRRFWSYVAPQPNGCWLWTGARHKEGYGLINVGGKVRRAHRWFYEQLHGQIEAVLVLDHLCHNDDKTCPGGPTCPHRACVNPTHVEPVTQRLNSLRGRPSGPGYCFVNGGAAAPDPEG